MALVIVTVVATGLVVANWGDKKVVDVSAGRATPAVRRRRAAPSLPAGTVPARGRSSVASSAQAAGRSMA
jgi:hypothetical protein